MLFRTCDFLLILKKLSPWQRFRSRLNPPVSVLLRRPGKGQATFYKENMADKMKIHGIHHVKLCKYCWSVADVINNALQRVIAWRQNILIGLLISPFVRVQPPSSQNP